MSIDRRTFIGAAALASFAPAVANAASQPVPKRRLGRTNEMVSMVALGGSHIGASKLSDGDASDLMHRAVDLGITFFDNCWDYNDGRSEMRMGKALAQGVYRDRVFLMTKADGRDAKTATGQLEDSLRRLQTDHVDLWQIHENIRPDDADRVFAPGGAIEAMVAAQKAGKVRFLGFTGHKNPAYHAHMFETAAKHNFVFDTVQMPVNVMDAHYMSFAQLIIPIAKRTDTAVLAMKTFGDHHILDANVVSPVDMLHYSMTQDVAVVVTGIDSPQTLDQAVTAAASFRPLSGERIASILAASSVSARDGALERYKTSHEFDGTINNPQWLGTPVV